MKNALLITLLFCTVMSCRHENSSQDSDTLSLIDERVVLNPIFANPLSARYDIKTTIPVRVRISIKGQDGEDLEHQFEEYKSYHQIPILGLYENHDNEVEFLLESFGGQQQTITKIIKTFNALDVPVDMQFKILKPQLMSDGFTMLHLSGTKGLAWAKGIAPIMIDKFGKIRWVGHINMNHVFKPLHNGRFMVDQDGFFLSEIDMLGTKYTQWHVGKHGVHHDAVQMSNGNILALTNTDGNPDDGVVEINTQTGKIVNSWDLKTILDSNRKRGPINDEADCWFHANGIDYYPKDDSFVISGRHQSAVVKIDRKTSKIKWILANHEYWTYQFKPLLLKPQGGEFEWQWGQHSPVIDPQDPTRILIYDNGCDKSYTNPVKPVNNYSRAVEYQIDEKNMTVSQTFQWGKERGSELYTPYIGNAQYTSNNNILICFGGITTINGVPSEINLNAKNSIRLVEVDKKTGEVAMELEFKNPSSGNEGYRSYRAYKINLY